MTHPYPGEEEQRIEDLHEYAEHGAEYVHLLECEVRELRYRADKAREIATIIADGKGHWPDHDSAALAKARRNADAIRARLLEAAEADLHHTKRKAVDPEKMHRTVRRAEMLESAVRTVVNDNRMAEDWSLPDRLEEYLNGVLADINESDRNES